MNLTARSNYLRISPRKAQLVKRLIAGRTVIEAEAQLFHSTKAASHVIAKLLSSAVANTLEQLEVSKDDLFIKRVSVNQGPTAHRFKPRAFGRAGKIRKRTSHISITLGVREDAGIDLEKVKKSAAAPDKPKTIDDIEKEMSPASDSSAKNLEADKRDVSQQKGTPEQKKGSSTQGAHKGTDKRFMKKIFSRKVG